MQQINKPSSNRIYQKKSQGIPGSVSEITVKMVNFNGQTILGVIFQTGHLESQIILLVEISHVLKCTPTVTGMTMTVQKGRHLCVSLTGTLKICIIYLHIKIPHFNERSLFL